MGLLLLLLLLLSSSSSETELMSKDIVTNTVYMVSLSADGKLMGC
jgi:hypothetical protein